MRLLKRLQPLLLAVFIAFCAVFISLGLLGEASPVSAQGQEVTESVNPAPYKQLPPPSDNARKLIAYFTDDFSVEITDLNGNILGEGFHRGLARCNENTCSQKTELSYTIPLTDPDYIAVYEYRFTSRLAYDPEAVRVVVAGTGKISSRGQRERFSFTATFQDNRDGTLSATYVASRPDASFMVPSSPGTFTIGGQP